MWNRLIARPVATRDRVSYKNTDTFEPTSDASDCVASVVRQWVCVSNFSKCAWFYFSSCVDVLYQGILKSA